MANWTDFAEADVYTEADVRFVAEADITSCFTHPGDCDLDLVPCCANCGVHCPEGPYVMCLTHEE